MKNWNLMLSHGARARQVLLVRQTLFVMGMHLAGALFVAAGAEAATVPFSPQQVISTAADGVRSVFAADLDGDGDVDLMSASHDDDEIAWYENDGAANPGFTRIVISTAADGAQSVFAADLDGDGDLDLMSASRLDDAIAWYENDGAANPSFTRIVVSTEADEASSVYAADLDGDGDLDLMSASFGDDEIAWYENDGATDPTFTRIVISTAADGARSVHAADLDGDGDLDLMSASAFDNEIAWYENDGAADPTFTRILISTAATGAQSVFAADVDGDGDLDLMSASANDNRIAWYENDGGANPTFIRIVISTASGASSVFAADVDGDGDLDLMSTSRFDDEIAWYENNGAADPSFTRRLISTSADGAQTVYAADVDGDGDLDLMSASQLDDKIAWYRNETIHRSAVYPTRHLITSAADGAYSVHAADVDGDGDLDLMSASLNDDEIAWYENNGAAEPSFTRRLISTLAEGAVSVYAGDVDGDGDLDLMSASRWDNAIAWYENDGGANPTFTRHVISTAANGATSVYAGDVDGDGDLDLMSASALDDAIAWYENDGGANPTFTRRVISTAADFGESVYAGDVDGDGDLDLMSASRRDNAIAWYENDGGASPTFTRHVISIAADDAASVHAGDVDGDGDLDLMSASSEDDEIAWYENDGGANPTFTRHVISTAANHATSVYAADVDGDGDLDLMSASRDDNEIAWYENDGGADPTFTRHVISTAANGAVSVYAGDVDGDGDLDLMSASTFDHEIAWYENEGGQFALPTADVAPVRTTNNATVAALEVDAIHRGRAGDQDVELVTLELLLEDGTATALTNATADALLEALTIYLDDGSGLLEPGSDAVVATVTSFSLTGGVLTVTFADADPNVQIPFGSPKKYFVALTFEAGASSQTPDEIRVTHITESSSTGEDADHDLPISLEFSSNRQSAVIEVNDAPVALGDAVMMFEDGGTVAGNVLDGSSGGLDSDEEGDSLSAMLVGGPSNGLLVGGLASGGAFTYQPNPDFNGVDSFTYMATDAFESSNTATVMITVDAVNDVPSFTIMPSVTVDQDLGPQTVPDFATLISAGPADEVGQGLTFNVTANTNPSLFSAAPALSSDGTLTFSSASQAVGVATITIALMDDGGTANGGVDTSGIQEFEIEIAGTPAMGLNPGLLSFGDVIVGQPASAQTVALTNTGGADLILGSLVLSGAAAGDYTLGSDTCSSQTVVPAASCTFEIDFTPSATGARAGQVDIPSNASTSPDAVSLDGTGIQAVVDVVPGALDFGDVVVGQTATAQTVTLTNSGSADLILGSLVLSGAAAGDYALGNDTCSSQTVTPAANCTFEIAFSPSATGARVGQVDIPSNAPTSPDAVGFAGAGIQAAVEVVPGALDFGDVVVGQPAAPQTVTLTNTGDADLILDALALNGAAVGDYELVNDTCSNQTVVPAASCTFETGFTPSATGARGGQVELPSNAPSSPDAVTLTGNGVQGTLTITPDPVEFGTQAVGTTSAAMSTTLQNTGSAVVNVSSVSAPDALFQAAGGTCGAVPIAIDPGASCTLDFTFNPIVAGVFDDTISVASDAPTSPDSFGLQGEGVVSEVMLSANPFDFGAVALGETEVGVIMLTNTGTGELIIDELIEPELPFAIIGGTCTALPVTLLPGASCDIEITFSPVAAFGDIGDALMIVSNAPTSPDVVTLSGSVQPLAIPVPTLDRYGLLLLMLLIAGFAWCVGRPSAS